MWDRVVLLTATNRRVVIRKMVSAHVSLTYAGQILVGQNVLILAELFDRPRRTVASLLLSDPAACWPKPSSSINRKPQQRDSFPENTQLPAYSQVYGMTTQHSD